MLHAPGFSRLLIACALAAISLASLAALMGFHPIADPAVLVALVGIAAVAYSLKIWLEADSGEDSGGITFDATVAIAVVALALLGESAAVLVWLVPDVIHRAVLRRAPLITPGLALNVASFALAALAGGALIGSLGGAVGLALAAVAMLQINFLCSGVLYAFLFESPRERRLLWAQHVALTPISLVVLAVAVLTAELAAEYGLPALALLSVAVALPEVRWRAVAERLEAPAHPRTPSYEREYRATEVLLTALLDQLDAATQARSETQPPARGPGRPPRRRPGHR